MSQLALSVENPPDTFYSWSGSNWDSGQSPISRVGPNSRISETSLKAAYCSGLEVRSSSRRSYVP
jgi:hypothetical protein